MGAVLLCKVVSELCLGFDSVWGGWVGWVVILMCLLVAFLGFLWLGCVFVVYWFDCEF